MGGTLALRDLSFATNPPNISVSRAFEKLKERLNILLRVSREEKIVRA